MEPLDTALPVFSPLPMKLVQPWEIFNELNKVKSRKASGPDRISAQFVCMFAYELSDPLSHIIIISSYSQSLVPLRWKLADIVPLPKSSPPEIGNLCPVTLTDHFAKIAEHFIAKELMTSLQLKIDPAQYRTKEFKWGVNISLPG